MTPRSHDMTEAEREYYGDQNRRRAAKRRGLYRSDPLYRLSRLKANRETALRRKLRGGD